MSLRTIPCLVAVLAAACNSDSSPPGRAAPPPAGGAPALPPRSEGTGAPPVTPPVSGAPRSSLPPGIVELPLRAAGARPTGGPLAGFTDITQDSGTGHRHRRGVFDARLSGIMPWISSIGSACAVSDYDLDGDIDLYVTTSRQGFPNVLYRNEGGLRFTETARSAGVADVNDAEGVSMDAAFADLDGDGDDELYVVEWGRNRLFRNEGNGTFADITAASGADDRGNGNAVLPFDPDQDGLLDLLVCNYFPAVDLTRLETTRIMHDSFEAARNGGADVLLKNLGGLRFRNIAHDLHVDDSGWSLDAGLSDVDNDGDGDVYIANDFGQDKLFLANGDGSFTDATERAIGRETFKGMNIDFGDFNGDGFTDGYVTNITTAEYLKEGNMLLLNAGDGTFSNVAQATGTYDGGWGWCGRFFDFDQDGHLDILTVNGFVTAGPTSYWDELAAVAVSPDFDPAEATQWPPMGTKSLSGNEPARLFRNRGDGSFEEVAKQYGIADRRDGRGIALADFDEDGDLDVYLANQDAFCALYRNDVGNMHRFLVVSLEGTRSNRNAIGARLQLTVAGATAAGAPRQLTREVSGMNSFASQSTYRVHFGLGQADRVEKLTVFWPSGIVQEFRDLAVDRHYKIVEKGEPMPREQRLAMYFGAGRGVASSGRQQESGAAPSLLLDLEERLRRRPCNAPLANRYRSLCVDARQFDRAVDFLRQLVQGHGEHTGVRLQLALALVDKIPYLEGDVMAQSSYAKESLQELERLEQLAPDSYGMHYISGMNHLYWPETLNHFDDAVRHFERCLAAHEAQLAATGKTDAQAVEVYRALGDAHVKGKRLETARGVWRAGLSRFPGSEALQARLALDDRAVGETIKEERGLKRRIDSSLAWLAGENGLGAAEARLRVGPGDRALLNAYRREALEQDQTGRAAGFIAELASRAGAPAELRLALSLALADRISSIAAATIEAFQLADRVLAELKAYRALAPADWLGPYFEGICHSFRPPSPEAAQAAVAAFREADRLVRRADGSPRLPQATVALGDALHRLGQEGDAIAVWQEALRAFPRHGALKARVEGSTDARRALLRSDYDLARGIPTDLDRLEDTETELAALEGQLRSAPRAAAASRYRQLVRRGEDRERAILFLQGLLRESPRSATLRVELALGYMDRIPDRDLGSVRKGLLSSEALKLLEEVATAHPGSGAVHFAVGLLHLNWFTKQNHVPAGVQALQRALAVRPPQDRSPTWAQVYQALGDAFIKDRSMPGGFAQARKEWKQGTELFPADVGLRERLGLTALMVNGYVERARSWDSVPDTAALSTWIGDLGDIPPGSSG